jgi:hypothetical protein
MKHRNQGLEINGLGILRKEFDIDVLEVDRGGHSGT